MQKFYRVVIACQAGLQTAPLRIAFFETRGEVTRIAGERFSKRL
jgi:hypothetical protein